MMITRLAWFVLICLSTSALGDTIESNPGETVPGNIASPNPATPFDVIQFSLDADAITYGNACEQQNAFDGTLALEINPGGRVIDVTSIEPAPLICTRIYSPVTGVRGELDPLAPGRWAIVDSFGNSATVNVVTPGDANKDGVFDSGDLVQVFKAAEYEDGKLKNSTWGEGDWTADMEFSSSDLVAAFQANGNGQKGLVAVPETCSTSLLAVMVFVFAATVSRRTQHC